MKKLICITFLILLSCSKEKGCIEITRKEKSGSAFLFFWQEEYYENYLGLEATPIPSGAVSEEVYNQFEVGDTYCID